MTNFSGEKSIKASVQLQKQQKIPLIPPASIRIPTPTGPQATSATTKKSSRPAPQQQQQQQPPPSSRGHPIAPHNMKLLAAPTCSASQVPHPSAKMKSQQISFGPEEVWTSVQDLFWDHMKEVQNKWNTLKLNDDIWAKLIYFEQNRRLAKAYVSAPVLTVDGSTHGLDGFRIGLSGIDNTYRNLDSMGCLRSIGQGIKLKIDHHGNILIRKIGCNSSGANNASSHHLHQHQHHHHNHHHQNGPTNGSQCSVWVKDWPSVNIEDSEGNPSVASGGQPLQENCMMREIEQSDVPYKLFDMRNFRSQLEERRRNNETNMDWRQCVSIISFVRSSTKGPGEKRQPNSLLEDPCWIMLINIIAIDMIKSSLSLSDEDSTINRLNGGGPFSGPTPNPPIPMESGNNRMGPNRKINHNNNSAKSSKGPHRTSSSSSILFPQSDPSGGFNRALSGTDSASNNLLLATSERIKKLRTSNNNNSGRSNRLTSMKMASNYSPRRYQSIQQLSSAAPSTTNSSTIYTTFNGKFANNGIGFKRLNNHHHHHHHHHHQQTDSSSTSDYNSGSRIGGQNYWRKQNYCNNNNNNNNNQIISYPLDSFNQGLHPNYRKRDEGRVMFSRKSLLPPIELGNKSLSTIDLSQRGFELRPMHSSIRMNYDYLTETEDNGLEDYEDDIEGGIDENNMGTLNSVLRNNKHEQLQDPVAVAGDDDEAATAAAAAAAASEDRKRLESHYNMEPLDNQDSPRPHKLVSSSDSSNELKSPSFFLETDTNLEDTSSKEHGPQHKDNKSTHQSIPEEQAGSARKAQLEHQPKLVSGSSLTSSSSSSGCADNDYFMSHSSSSMSSSTASNERELFSRPISSSGIVCSAGSTSDEYDEEGRKHTKASVVQQPDKSHHPSSNIHKSTSPIPSNMKMDGLSAANFVCNVEQQLDSREEDSKASIESRKHKQKKTIGPAVSNKSNNRKAFHKRTIANPRYCCDQPHDRLLPDGGDHLGVTSGFPPIEDACLHCCCNCLEQNSTAIDAMIECECSNESTHNNTRLLRSSPIASSLRNVSLGVKTKTKPELDRPRKLGQRARVSSLTKIDDSENDFGEISTIPMQQNHNQQPMITTKESQKQTGGWLERRGYSRIFPKFMFSSSSNSNNSRQLDAQIKDKDRSKKNGQAMVRLTRSTQDLS